MHDRLKKYFWHFTVIIFLVGFNIFHYAKDIKELPMGPHIWAHADRYAVTLGFLNNHFNFFLPRTLNLAPALPPQKPLLHKEGITRVDFPIHSYMAALIMKITGITGPLLFRLYTLIYSFIGLYFLFLLTKKLTTSGLKAFFIVIFASTIPAFTFYQSGTLPTIPAIANIFIGIWSYLRFKETEKYKFFYFALFFFVFAALPRLPVTTFLIAFAGFRCLEYIKQKKIILKEAIAFCISFGIIGAYFLYNVYLEKTYGSVFLSEITPPDGLKDFLSTATLIIKDNFYCYTTPVHFAISLLAVFLFFIKLKKNKDNFIARFSIIAATGVLIIFYLMISQYVYHDYYFLDTFFPVIILVLIFSLEQTKFSGETRNKIFSVLMILTLPLLLWYNQKALAKNYTVGPEDVQLTIRKNFQDADAFLRSAGISDTSSVLVADAYSVNYPLTLMNRKGYTLICSEADQKQIPGLLAQNPDYVIMQHCFMLSGILKYYPEITSGLEKIADNRRISVFKPVKKSHISVNEFLLNNKFRINYSSFCNFEKIPDPGNWLNIISNVSPNPLSGNNTGILEAGMEYSATCRFTADQIQNTKKQKALVEFYYKTNIKPEGTFIVFSIDSSSKNLVYYSEDISKQFNGSSWTHCYYIIPFNDIEKTKEITLKVYLWNKNKNQLEYDDFSVILIDKDYLN